MPRWDGLHHTLQPTTSQSARRGFPCPTPHSRCRSRSGGRGRASFHRGLSATRTEAQFGCVAAMESISRISSLLETGMCGPATSLLLLLCALAFLSALAVAPGPLGLPLPLPVLLLLLLLSAAAAAAAAAYLNARYGISYDASLVSAAIRSAVSGALDERRDTLNPFYQLEAHATSSHLDHPWIIFQPVSAHLSCSMDENLPCLPCYMIF